MIHHLNRAAGLCLTAALLLTAAGCGQQTVPESPSPSPVVKTAAADKNDLTVVRSMELQYANNFAVDYCANGCKIITDGAGQKFLWVPEGGEAPDDTGDMTVLQTPLTKLGCFSTTHATLFHAIGALDKVSLVTTDKDKWHIEQIAQQIEDGTTTYVGKTSAPDYELISAAAPQLGIMRWSTSWVKEPAATEEAQALKKKPRPKEKWEAGSPSQEFSSPRVRNAPIPCVVGA